MNTSGRPRVESAWFQLVESTYLSRHRVQISTCNHLHPSLRNGTDCSEETRKTIDGLLASINQLNPTPAPAEVGRCKLDPSP